MAHLVQLLLPTSDNRGRRFDGSLFASTRAELVKQFGGITAYLRSPAAGAWVAPEGTVERDAVVMVEVVVDDLDRAWWRAYLRELKGRFDQEEIHARAIAVDEL